MGSGLETTSQDSVSDEKQEYKSYSDMFREMLPYCLYLGMTYEQFYYKDMDLIKYYYEAETYRKKQNNENFWLQGMYIYEAVATVHYNLNRKKNASPRSYTDKPYDIYKDQREQARENEEKVAKAQAEVWMNNLVNMYKK